jgi:hypothetical protein
LRIKNAWPEKEWETRAGRMRNVITLLLIVVGGMLAFIAYSQRRALQEERRLTQQLTTKLSATSTTASLDLQEKCANQAREEFKREGWEELKSKGGLNDFSDHFNPKVNKCFVLIESTDPKNDGTVFVSKTLSDAFEGKLYGEYNWKSDKVKKYWQVPPFMCKVTLPSGEEKICHSDDEFDALVKQYME